jgi:hypothetical protein
VNVEAMITNDIVGNAHDDAGRRDATILRLFAEGARRQAGQRGVAAAAGHGRRE